MFAEDITLFLQVLLKQLLKDDRIKYWFQVVFLAGLKFFSVFG
jgi:hypothetical protein